jgi:hypothetical protein
MHAVEDQALRFSMLVSKLSDVRVGEDSGAQVGARCAQPAAQPPSRPAAAAQLGPASQPDARPPPERCCTPAAPCWPLQINEADLAKYESLHKPSAWHLLSEAPVREWPGTHRPRLHCWRKGGSCGLQGQAAAGRTQQRGGCRPATPRPHAASRPGQVACQAQPPACRPPPAALPPPPRAAAEQLRDRALAAVVGSLTADAAAMGVQWIYDLEAIAKLEKQRQQEVRGGSGPPLDAGPACLLSRER